MDVNDWLHAPVALTPDKETSVPIAQKAGWVPGIFWILLKKGQFPGTRGRLYMKAQHSMGCGC